MQTYNVFKNFLPGFKFLFLLDIFLFLFTNFFIRIYWLYRGEFIVTILNRLLLYIG
jgi:hypothetical protein